MFICATNVISISVGMKIYCQSWFAEKCRIKLVWNLQTDFVCINTHFTFCSGKFCQTRDESATSADSVGNLSSSSSSFLLRLPQTSVSDRPKMFSELWPPRYRSLHREWLVMCLIIFPYAILSYKRYSWRNTTNRFLEVRSLRLESKATDMGTTVVKNEKPRTQIFGNESHTFRSSEGNIEGEE